MKKLLFSVLAILSVAFAKAQEFEVTPDGLKEKTSGKDFVVIEVQGKTASELYNNAIKYINIMYKNPKEVIKGDVKDEYIKWETFIPNFGTIKNSFVNLQANALITVQLSFKDGKAKYEVVNQDIHPKENRDGKVTFKGSKWGGFPIYDEKDNKLRQVQLKDDIETYYNAQIIKLKDALNGSGHQTKNDDW